MSDKARIVELQKSLRMAKTALERIYYGHCQGAPHRVAENALDEMRRLEPKQQLQGLVGHGGPR